MTFNAAFEPGKAALLALLLSASLFSCSEPSQDQKNEVVPAPRAEALKTDAVQNVRYPEFERQERVNKIAAMAPSMEAGAEAFDTCATCHGARGYGSRDGQIPRIAGQLKPVLIEKLIEISDGIRHRPQMEPFIAGIDEDGEIAALAAHLAALRDPEDVRHGTGEELALGKKTFEMLCASCHEADGRGNGAGRIPRIAGWDAPAIRRTLVILGADYSEVHETGMSDLVSMMNEAEIDAVADYVSRLAAMAP